MRNYTVEFTAQRVERDSRDELYAACWARARPSTAGSVSATSWPAHQRRAHAQHHVQPGIMLITDSALGVVLPIVLIAQLKPVLLLVPSIFIVLLAVTLIDYTGAHPVSIACASSLAT